MAQSLKHLTVDFISGHDLTVCEIETCEPSAEHCPEPMSPAWDSLSPSPSARPSPTHVCAHAFSFSLKVNIKEKKANTEVCVAH